MKKTLVGLIILAAVIIANIIIYTIRPFGESFSLAGDIMVMSFSFAASALGFYAYRLHGWKSVQGKAILLISIGVFLWFLGESIWSFYDIALGIEAPFPSYADVAWFLGYPFFIAGLYYVWKVTKTPLTRRRISLAYILGAALLILMVFYAALPALGNPETETLEKAAALGYVIGDTALVIASSVVIISLIGGKLATPWIILIVSLILSCIADIVYTYTFASYQVGDWIDLLWNANYLLEAYAFFYYRSSIAGFLGSAGRRK
jgi:hypothetical protein